jgi:hypothetical protein
MLFSNILNWVLQNRWKTLIGTALVSGATYMSVESGLFDPTVNGYPKYHIRMDACAIQCDGRNLLDTLSIKLAICNDNPSNTLVRPTIKIDSAQVKLCNVDSMKFRVARLRNALGRAVAMDSLFYADVKSSKCELPNGSDPRLKQFEFCAPLMPRQQNAKTDSLCVHFTAKVYHSLNSKPDQWLMNIRVPVPLPYRLSAADSSAVSFAENNLHVVKAER